MRRRWRCSETGRARSRARAALTPTTATIALAVVLALGAGGCGSTSRAPARAGLVIGFLYVGSVHDHGYNEAAYLGSLALARAFPRARIIQREHVPESSLAEGVMERMIAQGATIIFPTSFGHLQPALNVAARNPSVTFLHQGGLQTSNNLGTYFGTIWQTEYVAGVAAGMATRTHRLGFVAAFPIAQSLLNINAFELGARSVNPRVRTRVLFTSSWCSPPKQRRAASILLQWHADVLTQHQDCPAVVIDAAAKAGAKAIGFHADARALAPRAWLTGSVWNWGALYVRMVRSILSGTFAQSPYAGRYRGGINDGTIGIAPFGEAATAAVRRRVLDTLARVKSGQLQPFGGPVRDQGGMVRIAGPQPSVADLEETNYLVEGVVGSTAPGA